MKIIGIIALVVGTGITLSGVLGSNYFEDPYRKGLMFIALGIYFMIRSYFVKKKTEKNSEMAKDL